jgi:hypothetical protein
MSKPYLIQLPESLAQSIDRLRIDATAAQSAAPSGGGAVAGIARSGPACQVVWAIAAKNAPGAGVIIDNEDPSPTQSDVFRTAS